MVSCQLLLWLLELQVFSLPLESWVGAGGVSGSCGLIVLKDGDERVWSEYGHDGDEGEGEGGDGHGDRDQNAHYGWLQWLMLEWLAGKRNSSSDDGVWINEYQYFINGRTGQQKVDRWEEKV